MDESGRIERTEREATRRLLAGLLAQRGLGFFDRLAARAERRLDRWNAYWVTLSRRGRRRWQQQLAVTLAGAALLLTLARLPAMSDTITVVNGEVGVVQNGLCSLIEAIHNANDTTTGVPHADCVPGDPAGADEIVLPADSVFLLTTADNKTYGPSGLPVINSAVTLSGNGATIRRYETAEPFRILAVAATGDLTLAETTLRGGTATTGIPYYNFMLEGGGILSFGKLTVRESVITRNRAGYGGGVAVEGGTAIFESATISDNSSGVGGGIYNERGSVRLSYSTVSGNEAFDGLSGGGGIGNFGGALTLVNSTVSGNEAFNDGGGIGTSGALTLVNSTVSGNQAWGSGGGLSVWASGSAHVIHSTFTGNAGRGDGISVSAAKIPFGPCITGSLYLEHSIVSGNGTTSGSDEVYAQVNTFGCRGHVSTMGNLFGHDGDAGLRGFTAGATDLVAAGASAEVLGPLGDNDGPTQTHALAENSPAIDAAPSAACEAAPVGGIDQRGEPRPRDNDGVPTNSECDIGAFEAPGSDPQPPLTFTISVPVVLR